MQEILTLRNHKEAMEFKRQKWIGKVTEKLFQKSSDLDGVVFAQVHRRRILVNRLAELLQTPDVAVLSENAFYGHICITEKYIWKLESRFAKSQ